MLAPEKDESSEDVAHLAPQYEVNAYRLENHNDRIPLHYSTRICNENATHLRRDG